MLNTCVDESVRSKTDKKIGFRRFSFAGCYLSKDNSQDTSAPMKRISLMDSYSYDKGKEDKNAFQEHLISEEFILSKSAAALKEDATSCLPIKFICKKSQEKGFDFNNFSQQSVLCAMNRFVKSVNNMDSTILVPSKLKDIDISTKSTKPSDCKNAKSGSNGQNDIQSNDKPFVLTNEDLFSFYTMLNEMKKYLLWGNGSIANLDCPNSTPCESQANYEIKKSKHTRQPSDDSLGSLGSTLSTGSTLSNSDQETDDSQIDSFFTDRDSIDEHKSLLIESFRYHLQGFHTILNQLADSADYITARYQQEIDLC